METRENCIELVGEAVNSGARKDKACDVLGVSLRTMERWIGNPEEGDLRMGPVTEPANKLSSKEQKKIIEACTSEEYKDLPPTQIVPRIVDKGQYLGSESTFYRILKAAKLLAHRSDAKPKKVHKPDEHIATGPNQVWSWDVTYLKTYTKGMFFYLYLIMDVYSRKIVGWDIHTEDNSENAGILAEITCMLEDIEKDQIVLHSDNGASQKGATMLGTLERLGVAASFSRPSVSNDNPYSESLFKTIKYNVGYPKVFESISMASEWMSGFVNWYNKEHLHSGIKFVTPNQRHNGSDKDILKKRKMTYMQAKLKHPERWCRDIKNWDWEKYVYLNPVNKEDLLTKISA